MSAVPITPREGRIRTANDLERGCLALLEERLTAYGDAVARQGAEETPLVAPRSYSCSSAFDRWAEDQLPAIVVVSPGTLEPPELRGGIYGAAFGLVVGVYCSAATEIATHELVRIWTAAIRSCLVQTPSLGGLVSELVLLEESYDDVDVSDRRTYAAGTVAFLARVSEIVSVDAGPLLGADPPDLGPWPEVLSHDVEIARLPEMQEEESA